MIRVVIESAFGRNIDGSKCTPAEYARNARYLDRCIRDSLSRGEAPYASHGFFPAPGRLDDTSLEQRKLGIEAGRAWGQQANIVAVYQDHGVTEGTLGSVELYKSRGMFIEYRSIGAEPEVAAGAVEPCNCPNSKRLAAELAVVTAERDYLLTGVSEGEARVMRRELAKESGE